jgi:hypothetical protein
VIHVSAEVTWRLIGDFGAACHCLSGIVRCTAVGAGVGALRTLTHEDGSTVVERLVALDAASRRLSYTLLTDTPFGRCLTTMAVRALGPSHCELTWSATFKSDGLPESEAAELMQAALSANCLALKRFLERRSVT